MPARGVIASGCTAHFRGKGAGIESCRAGKKSEPMDYAVYEQTCSVASKRLARL